MAEDGGNVVLWTAEEVAAFLKVHVQTVYAKAASGEIPSRKMGKLRRFVRSEIEEYALAGTPPEAA